MATEQAPGPFKITVTGELVIPAHRLNEIGEALLELALGASLSTVGAATSSALQGIADALGAPEASIIVSTSADGSLVVMRTPDVESA